MTRRVVTALLAVSISVLLGAANCEEQDTHPSAPRVPNVRDTPPRKPEPTVPDPHAGDPQPSNKKERTFTVRVGGFEKEVLPVDVNILALHATPQSHHDILSSGSVMTKTFSFDANGPSFTIVVDVTPARPGSSRGWCGIEAGTFGNDGPRYVARGLRVQCTLRIHTGH